MNCKGLILTVALLTVTAFAAGAAILPPPVNQSIGIIDTTFQGLETAQCRTCHTTQQANVTRHHLLVGTPMADPTAAPNGAVSGNYGCISCHNQVWDAITFTYTWAVDYRDCLRCHTQSADGTVHHLSLGDPNAPDYVADCKKCHGSLVDNIGDGHYIPTYDPSMVTPFPGIGDKNFTYTVDDMNTTRTYQVSPGPNGEGNCAFCHAAGTEAVNGVDYQIHTNENTHHMTGFGLVNSSIAQCVWCHNNDAATPIRNCEGCHGPDSLHNIQVDSNGDGILPGGELAGYGHIGNNWDCDGCHGFSLSQLSTEGPAIGPIVPTIDEVSASVAVEGKTLPVSLTGQAFVTFGIESTAQLIDSFGTIFELPVLDVSETTLETEIPGYLQRGSYTLQLVKSTSKGTSVSNPKIISVVPEVAVSSANCANGTVVISGSGFGEYLTANGYVPVAEETGVVAGDQAGSVVNWNDTRIEATFAACAPQVTVNALYGSVSAPVIVEVVEPPVVEPPVEEPPAPTKPGKGNGKGGGTDPGTTKPGKGKK